MLHNMKRTSLTRRAGLFAMALTVGIGGLVPATAALARGPITIPSGTTMRVRVETTINSGRSEVGTPFQARVIEPVLAQGEAAVPADTMVTGRVVGVTQGKAAWGQPSGVTIAIDTLKSPLGPTVDVIGDLMDGSGVLLNTVDNLQSGTEISFRTTRSITVGEEFYMARGGGQGGQDTDVFNTQGTVTQAQGVLRDLGYYTGPLDGRLSAATRTAIGLFQRDNRLQQTGFLDRNTIDRLGLIGNSGQEVQAINVLTADAQMRNNGQLFVRIVAQTPSTGWQVFEDHFRQRDTLHIYVRGVRPGGYQGQVVTSTEVPVTLNQNEFQGLNRIVVHGASRDVTITANAFDQGSTGSMTPEDAAALEAQISRALSDYARVLGLRYNPLSGQIVMTRANYRENEIELLFALNSLASSAKLYTQVLRNTTDPDAIKGATDLYVSQANMVDRAVARTRSGRAAGVARAWDGMRDDFVALDTNNSMNREGVGYRP